MAPNLPVMLYVALVLVLPLAQVPVSTRDIGVTASVVTLATVAAALGQHYLASCAKVELMAGNALTFATTLLLVTFLNTVEAHLAADSENNVDVAKEGGTVPAKPTDQGVSQRGMMWAGAVAAIKERPVFGHGHANRFSTAQSHLSDQSFTYSHVHNALLTHLVGGGVIGGLAFVVFVLSPVLLLRFFPGYSRDARYLAVTVTLTAVMTGLTNLVLNQDLLSSVYTFSVVAVLLVLVAGQRRQTE